MINAINEIIKCVTEVYFITGLISLIAFYRFKREVFFLFFLSLAVLLIERSLFFSQSSRYYAIYLVLFLFLFITTLIYCPRGPISLRPIFLSCLLIAVVFNLIKCFNSFQNNYIFDLKESVDNKLKTRDHTTVFIERSEFNRLYASKQNELKQKVLSFFPSTAEELDGFFSQYDFWDEDVLLYTFGKSMRKNVIQFNLNINRFTLNKIESYNSYNNKKISVYSLDRFHPPVFSCAELRSNPFIIDVLENGIMKSCNPKYDSYIFQRNNQLIWFIGTPIDKQTTIIYLLHTDKPELLPPNRIVHKYDNLCFRIGTPGEIGVFGPYRVFAKDIPTAYPITKITVGLVTENEVYSLFKPIKVSEF